MKKIRFQFKTNIKNIRRNVMKKKIGAILAAAAMACTMTVGVAFSGCGMAKITEFDMPEGGYDGSKVTITFANTTGQNLERIVADAIADFNVLYPNITVKVDNSNKNWSDLNNNIATKITTGKQPHIAYCYSDHVAQYNEYNAVLPLNDFLPDGAFKDMTVTNTAGEEALGLTQAQKDDYVDIFFAEGSVYGDNKIYTLPFAKSTEVMFYNEDFFKAHPDIKIPTTWEEMEETCEKIQNIIGKNNGKYPLGYDSDANLFITMCEQHESPYTSAAGKDHFLFNNETNRNFVKDLVEWYKKGYLITQNTNGPNKQYTSYLFTEEKCIMSIGSTGGASYQDPGAVDDAAKFTVGVARVPQLKPDKPKTILQGPSVCIFKKDNPQEVIASWLLVKYLTTNVMFQGRYSEVSGYIPVTKSAYQNPLYQEFLSEGSLTARVASTCAAMVEDNAFYTSDAFPGSSKARERVEILMEAVFFGKDIADEFAKAVKACNDYINNIED